MQHAWTRGVKLLIIEGDCKKAIDILNKETLQFDTYNWIRDINWWTNQFEEVRFVWTHRDANQVADLLAKQSLLGNDRFYYYNYVLSCVTHYLHSDFVSSEQVY